MPRVIWSQLLAGSRACLSPVKDYNQPHTQWPQEHIVDITSNSNGEGRALKRGGYVYVCALVYVAQFPYLLIISVRSVFFGGIPQSFGKFCRQFCGYTEPPCIITYALTYTTHSTGPSCPRCVWSDIIQRLPTNRQNVCRVCHRQ